MYPTEQLTSLTLYRWQDPATTCDYPVLAVAEDRSALLSLGNYSLCMEWGIPAEAAHWLAHDFAATGESFTCNLSLVRHLLDTLFPAGTHFALVSFGRQLQPMRLQLSLSAQASAEDGPEYALQRGGRYRRVYRGAKRDVAVTLAEYALLDVWVSMLTELTPALATKLTEPPPPRYRSTSTLESESEPEPEPYIGEKQDSENGS